MHRMESSRTLDIIATMSKYESSDLLVLSNNFVVIYTLFDGRSEEVNNPLVPCTSTSMYHNNVVRYQQSAWNTAC